MSRPSYDHLFKIIVIGDSGVGKSSLLCQFVDQQFSTSFIPTIGVDFKIKTLDFEGKQIKLQLWDTAGQDRFRAITRPYYKNADGILVIYDVTNPQSFHHVKDWLDDVARYSPKRAVMLLVGNKADLRGSRAIEMPAATELARQLGLEVVETSAKDSSNVEGAFDNLIGKILARRHLDGPPLQDDTVTILPTTKSVKPGCSC